MRNDKMEESMRDKNKRRNRVILILIIVLGILTGGRVAYANKDTLINHFYLITKSPSDYYTYIEQYGLYQHLSSSSGEATEEAASAYNISSQISFHRKELDSVLETSLGTNLTNLEELLGIPIQSVGVNIHHASVAQYLNETIGIHLNNTNLITAELYMDSFAQNLSLRLPELSKAYLTKSLNQGNVDQTINEEQGKLIDKDLMKRILGRYTEIYFNQLGTVTLQEKVPLSLDTLEVECNLLTVTFTKDEAMSLYLTLFNTAKSDEDILSLLPSLHITEEQYLQMLEKAQLGISEVFNVTSKESTLQMKLYVDKKGHILGRELTSFGQDNIGYTRLTQEDHQEYELHLSLVATDHKLNIKGTNRQIEDANQGKLAVRLHAPSITSAPDLSLDVTYEDASVIVKHGRHYMAGSYTLSTEKLAGIQVTSEFNINEDQQLNTTVIRLGASPLITINTEGSPLAESSITLPEDTSTQFDSNQYEDYFASMDLEGYLTTLADSLGINPESIMDLLTSDLSR
jgi:hypothetical protein